jgi:dihydrofolate synthase/folylpolyglutamate synthase
LIDGKLSDLLPKNWQLWLDGGHNPAAAVRLAEVLADWAGDPVDLVVGMLRTRDPVEFLAPLAPFVTRVRAVVVPGEDSTLTAEELAAAARRVGIDADPADSVSDAVRSLVDRPGGRILICGSLYLAGSVLANG